MNARGKSTKDGIADVALHEAGFPALETGCAEDSGAMLPMTRPSRMMRAFTVPRNSIGPCSVPVEDRRQPARSDREARCWRRAHARCAISSPLIRSLSPSLSSAADPRRRIVRQRAQVQAWLGFQELDLDEAS